MDLSDRLLSFAQKIDPRLLGFLTRQAKRLDFLRARIDAEYEHLLAPLEHDLWPYRGDVQSHVRLPESGLGRDTVLAEVRALGAREEERWREGYASGAVYHGDSEHIAFQNEVYALTSQLNPLHSDLWPSAVKYEAEIVSMTAHMLGADQSADEICGTVTSGGTESILMAMKAYRDQARDQRGIRRPNVVLPISAHPAFDKAAHLFGLVARRTPVGADFRADVRAVQAAIDGNTIALVGSAPCFPHGVIDPIAELSELARGRGIGFHTDSCLGGFVLPFARKLGAEVPAFDFALPGVTSMSADTHKYAYAAKGTSVVLYRGRVLRRYQYHTSTDWPGGLYFSPTLAGSRPGALSAACWAALVSIGEQGYLDATRRILDTAAEIKRGIGAIPPLRVLGDPLWVIAFDAQGLDIFRVLEEMTRRKWSLNGLHRPAAVHIALTLRHTQPGVAERFLDDLRASVAQVQATPGERGSMAPVYGLAAAIPFRAEVGELLTRFIDLLYEVPGSKSGSRHD